MTGEKSYYIENAPGCVKYCSAERLEKLRTREGKKEGMTPEQLVLVDAAVVAKYKIRTTASAPNVEVDIKREEVKPEVAPAPEAEVKPEVTITETPAAAEPTTEVIAVEEGKPEVAETIES